MPIHTQAEIIARIRIRQKNDFLGFETSDYAAFLDYEHVKAFLEPDHDEVALRAQATPELTRAAMVAKMFDYMPCAWEKANNQRGPSANRSISHYIAWTWLAGDVALSEMLERMYRHTYKNYDKSLLVAVAEHYGWAWEQWDNGELRNSAEF